MSRNFELQGIIHSIDETREYGQNGFTKREFVVKLTGEGERAEYPNYVALEFLKDRCSLLDSYNIGDEVKVSFNLSGRLWSAPGKPEKCFTSLQAWRIEALSGSNAVIPPPEEFFSVQEPSVNTTSSANFGSEFDDDVPF